jgi:uncharacterized protein YkwD
MRPCRPPVALGFLLLASTLTVAACGGDGPERESAPASVSIGEARIATNDRRSGGLEPSEQRGGVVQGAPSLDDLDRSDPPESVAGRGGCGSVSLQPTESNLAQIERATRCLINVERRSRGLRGLRPNRRLARAALGHSRDMVRRSYFAHDSRSGASFSDRIRRRGYMTRATRWAVGENIAWGAGPRATPRRIVEAWMDSPPHRANILNRRFREIGLGIVLGAPRRGTPAAATYNTAFGARRGGG